MLVFGGGGLHQSLCGTYSRIKDGLMLQYPQLVVYLSHFLLTIHHSEKNIKFITNTCMFWSFQKKLWDFSFEKKTSSTSLSTKNPPIFVWGRSPSLEQKHLSNLIGSGQME